MLDKLSRSLKLIAGSLSLLLVLLWIFPAPPNYTAPHPLRGASYVRRGFHVLLPATRSGPDFCRLVLSSAVAGYPDPVVLGWEGRGLFNGTESRLSKISEALAYLRTLNKGHDDDLVLLVDAHDVILQLPPAALIKRYHQALARTNSRLRTWRILGRRGSDGVAVRNTILFAADKTCGPRDESKRLPACNMAPKSTLSDVALGPTTDQRLLDVRPRFLNSGTIMGPVGDMRALLLATLDKVDEQFNEYFEDKHSDQHYFSLVWEEQERSRELLRKGAVEWDVDERVEFNIALDYESDAFFTADWNDRYVAWMRFNRSVASTGSPKSIPTARLDHATLTEDIRSLPGPFDHWEKENETSKIWHQRWADVKLGMNTATETVFPLYHAAGQRKVRDEWWSRLWFHPVAEAALKAARRRHLEDAIAESKVGEPAGVAVVEKIKYVSVQANQGDELQRLRARDKSNAKGGVWNDVGEYMSWEEICRPHERKLFLP